MFERECAFAVFRAEDDVVEDLSITCCHMILLHSAPLGLVVRDGAVRRFHASGTPPTVIHGMSLRDTSGFDGVGDMEASANGGLGDTHNFPSTVLISFGDRL